MLSSSSHLTCASVYTLNIHINTQLYHHGESLAVNVHIANNSSKTVKKIKVSVRQFADICLFSTAQYKCTVAEVESEWVQIHIFFVDYPSMLPWFVSSFVYDPYSIFTQHTLNGLGGGRERQISIMKKLRALEKSIKSQRLCQI